MHKSGNRRRMGAFHTLPPADHAYHFQVTDRQGNVRLVTGAGGTVEQSYDYHPYGEEFSAQALTGPANAWRYGGKEKESMVGTRPQYDFGARRMSPAYGRFTTMDPLAEKYYHISPYVYCAGDPVNYVDPTGEYTYYVSRKGKITREGEEEDYDTVYSEDQSSSIILFDTSIMAELYNNGNNKGTVEKPQGTGVKSYVTSDHANAIYKTFKFLADNTGVEWVVHRNGDQYTLGTLHLSENSGNWADYEIEKPVASVHSHPNVEPSEKSELDSMGYSYNEEGPSMKKYYDSYNARMDILQNGNNARMSYVYFTRSKRLYYLSYNRPRFIRKVNNSYRQFFFGTLNHR